MTKKQAIVKKKWLVIHGRLMEIIKYFSQPRWVLITASQNHSNGEPPCKIKRSERVIRGILHIKGLLKKDTNMLTRKEIKATISRKLGVEDWAPWNDTVKQTIAAWAAA